MGIGTAAMMSIVLSSGPDVPEECAALGQRETGMVTQQIRLLERMASAERTRNKLGGDGEAAIRMVNDQVMVAQQLLGRGCSVQAQAQVAAGLEGLRSAMARRARAPDAAREAEMFDALMAMTRSLLEAAASRGAGPQALALRAELDAIEADWRDGNKTTARTILDSAAERVRALVIDQLDQQTLSYETVDLPPDQEWASELERYQGQRLLLDLLWARRPLRPTAEKAVKRRVFRAQELSDRAQSVSAENLGRALDLIGEANGELEAALRLSGAFYR